jgi:hypothetical protein
VRRIPDPGFSGDEGRADPTLEAALASYAQQPERYAATLAVLQHTRLLVPVVALLGDAELDEQGRRREKTSDMAAVLMQGQDGRTALLAFTGTEALRAWQPDARPVPVTAVQAAQSARQDGADALLVDVAGPVMFVVEGEDLEALAAGYGLVEVNGRYGWAGPAQ